VTHPLPPSPVSSPAPLTAPLSDAEWDRVFELARAHGAAGRAERDRVLAELRRGGARELLCAALEVRWGLGEPAPDGADAEELVGGRFRVRLQVGSGGAGSVFLGVSPEVDAPHPVAVKLLRLPRAAAARRAVSEAWERERDLLGEFSSSGRVPALLAAGEHRARDGTEYLYLCTEYKHGLNLVRWCREHALASEARIALFLDLCDAVALLHRHGLVHGDLTPANVHVEAAAGHTRVWILDLGLAAVRGRPWADDGALIGTPGYMSPEQLSADCGPVDDRTDVFALGVLLFELLEERPWLELPSALTPASLRETMGQAPAIRLASIAEPARRTALEAALRRATALAPQQRFAQVSALAEALRARPGPSGSRAQPGPLARLVVERAFRLLLGVALLGFGALLLFAFAPSARVDALLERALAEYPGALAQSCEGAGGAVDEDCALQHLALRLGTDSSALRGQLRALARRLGEGPGAAAVLSARAAYLMGEHAEAERLALRAAQEQRAQGWPDPTDTAAAYELAAEAALQRLSPHDALHYLGQAQARLDRRAHPVEWASVERVRAGALYQAREHARALAALEPLLGDLERRLGPAHPLSLSSRSLLAAVLMAQGRYADAEREQRQLLVRRRELLGPEDPDTLASLHNLAIALELQGQLGEAERLYRELLPALQRRWGAQHRRSLRAQHNLATLLSAQRRDAEAAAAHQAVATAYESALGPDDPETLTALESLAAALRRRGERERAALLQRRVSEARARTLGPAHADTLQSRYNEVLLLADASRFEEAEPQARELLQACAESLEPTHPLRRAALDLHAHALAGRGQHHAAAAAYRELLASYAEPPGGPAAPREQLAAAYVNLSWQLLLADQRGEALRTAEEGLARCPGERPLELNRAHALLLTGSTAAAREVYLRYRGQRAGEDQAWEDALAQDFAALERAGLGHALFASISAQLRLRDF
jgi:hypothetical protein